MKREETHPGYEDLDISLQEAGGSSTSIRLAVIYWLVLRLAVGLSGMGRLRDFIHEIVED